MLGRVMKKRSRIDIYAAILGFLKRHSEGCQVTRLSYGAGLPIDRIKLMLDTLVMRLADRPIKGTVQWQSLDEPSRLGQLRSAGTSKTEMNALDSCLAGIRLSLLVLRFGFEKCRHNDLR
jgi:hypothetical protein